MSPAADSAGGEATASTPRPEPAKTTGTESNRANGPLIVNGAHERTRSSTSTSPRGLQQHGAEEVAGHEGRGGKPGLTAVHSSRYSDPGVFSGAGLSNSASGLETNGTYTQRGPDGVANNGSDSSHTVQGEESPGGLFQEPYHGHSHYHSNSHAHVHPNSNPHPRPPPGFERSGIVFGIHEDSPPPSGNHSPVHHSGPPDFYYFQPAPPPPPPPPHMQMPHPYPFFPGYPAYGSYPNPFCAPHEELGMMAPSHQPEYPGYNMPHYYANPMYGAPYQPYHAPGDYTPYGSGDSPANYENEFWSGDNDNSTEPCTPDSVPSDKDNQCADGEGEHVEPADNTGGNEPSQEGEAEESADWDSRIVPPVQDTSSMPRNDPVTTNGEVTVPEKAPAAPKNTATLDKKNDDDDELEPASAYLLRAFKSGEFADYQLHLESPLSRFYAMTFLAHGLVIARSPCLYSRMQFIERAGEQKILTITTGNSFLQPKAFEIAVQNLYGLPLVKESQLASQVFLTLGHESGGGIRDSGGKVASCYNARMDFALCYAASGAFLANSSIVRRGIQLAVSAINWETVETALRFGLAASSFTLACADDVQQQEAFNRGFSENDSVGSSASEHGDAARVANSWETSYFVANTLNQGLVEAHAPEVLRKALEFMAESTPSDFELYSDAQPTVMPGRVPDIFGRATSRISSVVKFGELGTASDDKPAADVLSRETTVASAIMISLPFKNLRKLFKSMRSRGRLTQKLVEDVVAERERRRVRALRAFNSRGSGGGGGNNSDGDGSDSGRLPDPLGWAEVAGVMPSDGRSSSRMPIIHRSWQGSYTSPLTFGPEKSGGV